MKKLITNLKVLMTLLLLCGVSSAWAQSTILLEDYQSIGFTTTDGVFTLLAEKNNGSTQPTYNTNNKDARVYAKGTLTLTCNTGTMTKIVFNISSQGLKRQAEITPSTGTMTHDMSAKTVTWTGSGTSVAFTVGDKADYGTESTSAGQFDFVSIDVTFTSSITTTVETPDFSQSETDFVGSTSTEITCATEGATIYYTLDGTNPTKESTPYTGVINITETTTIKAIAYKGSDASTVASKTYTKVPLLTTLDEIFDKATNVNKTATTVYVTFNNWVISGVAKNNAYATDGTKGFVIYQSGHGFEAGDILSGTAKCKVQLYNGSAELTSLTSTTDGLTVTKGGTLTPREVSIAELSGVNTGALIVLNGIRLDNENVFTDGTDEITVYKTFMSLPEFDAYALTYSITGIYIQYNTTKEIAPRTESDINKNQVAIAIGSTGYATYSTPNYIVIPDAASGVQLFGARINDEGTAVTLIPAPEGQTIGLKGAGYIVKATPNTIAFIEQTGENGNDIEGNQLVGTVHSEYDLTQGEAYLLSATSDGTPFFGLCNEGTLAPCKAFLPVPAPGVKAILAIEEGSTTGINTIKNAELNIQDAIYNLAGQKVGADYKGIVIRNGKKMLNK